jgi:hypothetical protein
MATFDVPVVGAPPPQQVSDAVYASAVVDPQAFVLLVTDNDHPNGLVTMYHRLQRFEPQLGRPTPFDGMGFAFHGDVAHGQVPPSVEWPANAFHQVNAAVRVPQRPAIEDWLAANPDADLMDPPDGGAADTELVRVRNCMLVPYRYVRLLFQHSMSPREAWEQLAGALDNDGTAPDCQPLIDWLRVALVRQAAGQPSRLARNAPTVPLSTPALVERRLAIVQRDLPNLIRAPGPGGGLAVATHLGTLVADLRQNRLADEARRALDAERTPEKYYGAVGVAKLLRICQVATADGLPRLWTDLASAPKKQDLVTIQQAFDHVSNAVLNMPGTRIPVTPDIAGKIRSLGFEMTDEEDLTTGLHPFTFGYQDQSEVAAAYEMAERYQIIQQGLGAPTLSEAAEFARPTRTKLPRTLTEATISYGNFRVALHVLLGGQHAVTRAYDAFWSTWNASQAHLLNIRTRTPGLFPALTVRWIQLRVSFWFGQQALTNANVAAPDFVQLLREIRLQTPWEPYFPDRYLGAPPAAEAASRSSATAPRAGPAPATSSGGAAGGAGAGSNAQTRGTLERKSSPLNQAFQPFVDLNLRVRDVLQRAGPSNRVPTNSSGVEMCMSYHLKGMCNTNCSRRGDHRDHTPAEDQALLGWCQQHYRPE